MFVLCEEINVPGISRAYIICCGHCGCILTKTNIFLSNINIEVHPETKKVLGFETKIDFFLFYSSFREKI